MDLFGRWCINRQPTQFVLKGPSWETSGWRGAGSGLGGALGSESLPGSGRKCKILSASYMFGVFADHIKEYIVGLQSLSRKSLKVQPQ